jgi:hypothetical protein
MPTGDIAAPAWRDYGQVNLTADLEEAYPLANDFASEYVQVLTQNPRFARDENDGALPTLYAAVADIPGNSFAGQSGIMEQRGTPSSLAALPPPRTPMSRAVCGRSLSSSRKFASRSRSQPAPRHWGPAPLLATLVFATTAHGGGR